MAADDGTTAMTTPLPFYPQLHPQLHPHLHPHLHISIRTSVRTSARTSRNTYQQHLNRRYLRRNTIEAHDPLHTIEPQVVVFDDSKSTRTSHHDFGKDMNRDNDCYCKTRQQMYPKKTQKDKEPVIRNPSPVSQSPTSLSNPTTPFYIHKVRIPTTYNLS